MLRAAFKRALPRSVRSMGFRFIESTIIPSYVAIRPVKHAESVISLAGETLDAALQPLRFCLGRGLGGTEAPLSHRARSRSSSSGDHGSKGTSHADRRSLNTPLVFREWGRCRCCSSEIYNYR